MNYPLSLIFKLLTLGQEIRVTEPSGQLALYVNQKAFKLKEDIQVFGDALRSQLLYTIKADRVLDFSAKYHFADAMGTPLGLIRREGMRSLWKAEYHVEGPSGEPLFTVTEENPWIKVADALLEEVPVVGMFSGYLFHPAYRMVDPAGRPVLRLTKHASMVERRYAVERVDVLPIDNEIQAVLGMMLVVLLERSRG